MMDQLQRISICTVLGLTLAANAVQAQTGGSVPDWMSVDDTAKTVSLTIVAGGTPANNSWNFNGYVNGEATVVVPVGYTVDLTFTNQDQVMAHSLGIGALEASYPAMFDSPAPAFEGAMSSNPTDMMNATKVGESEVLTFVADEAGDYAIICYVPAHATTGMWIGFRVSADGSSGVEK